MKRSVASQRLIALREALGKTQQAFAVECLGSAITTVARYETSHPPRGGALLKLADIAARYGEHDLFNEFLELYLDGLFEEVDKRPALRSLLLAYLGYKKAS